jgi:hypothetical protein
VTAGGAMSNVPRHDCACPHCQNTQAVMAALVAWKPDDLHRSRFDEAMGVLAELAALIPEGDERVAVRNARFLVKEFAADEGESAVAHAQEVATAMRTGRGMV